MPILKLTDAESLLLVYVEEDAQVLEKQAKQLLQDAATKRTVARDMVFASHDEKNDGVPVKVITDPTGRPTHFEWEKSQ